MARDLKDVYFCGTTLSDLRAFPDGARNEAGYQLHRVQTGRMPTNFDHLAALGTGIIEVRIQEDGDAFRVVYVAKFEEAVYVLHAFRKKAKRGKAIPPRDRRRIESRYAEVVRDRPARD